MRYAMLCHAMPCYATIPILLNWHDHTRPSSLAPRTPLADPANPPDPPQISVHDPALPRPARKGGADTRRSVGRPGRAHHGRIRRGFGVTLCHEPRAKRRSGMASGTRSAFFFLRCKIRIYHDTRHGRKEGREREGGRGGRGLGFPFAVCKLLLPCWRSGKGV